ncbi:unannotated protein [freshwater metagenome]|uniref:Unannotated protein n=1 Tax=freshwater metagenome TaxID=449393 RepID=A0A6J7HFM4_9ZZZZ|nr:DUF3040 domain-containing protein [Actinomycetota bacterium]MSY78916.1 DUF3040 domain-containing protein [Actinomycetota bacterium]
MPLSEDEQRILGEIEQNLRASDPDLARQVGSTTVYTESVRRLKWGVFGFTLALIASVLLLAVSYLAAFAGFLVVFALAIFIESNARQLGRAGMNEATQALRNNGSGSLKDYFNDASTKAKDRLRRPEDE